MSPFQTRRMLEDRWTDANGLTRFLNAYGYDVKYPMIAQWFARDRVPGEWSYLILALSEVETGSPISLARYVA